MRCCEEEGEVVRVEEDEFRAKRRRWAPAGHVLRSDASISKQICITIHGGNALEGSLVSGNRGRIGLSRGGDVHGNLGIGNGGCGPLRCRNFRVHLVGVLGGFGGGSGRGLAGGERG